MKSALKILGLSVLILTLAIQFSVSAKNVPDSFAEITEVKDLGISARDDSKSIIEIGWRVNPATQNQIASFDLTLSVTYADGTIVTVKKQSGAALRSLRVEIPSAKLVNGKPPAFIKKLNAVVIAVSSTNQN